MVGRPRFSGAAFLKEILLIFILTWHVVVLICQDACRTVRHVAETKKQ